MLFQIQMWTSLFVCREQWLTGICLQHTMLYCHNLWQAKILPASYHTLLHSLWQGKTLLVATIHYCHSLCQGKPLLVTYHTILSYTMVPVHWLNNWRLVETTRQTDVRLVIILNTFSQADGHTLYDKTYEFILIRHFVNLRHLKWYPSFKHFLHLFLLPSRWWLGTKFL